MDYAAALVIPKVEARLRSKAGIVGGALAVRTAFPQRLDAPSSARMTAAPPGAESPPAASISRLVSRRAPSRAENRPAPLIPVLAHAMPRRARAGRANASRKRLDAP